MPLEDPNTVKNYFTTAFVLDKPKLTRMLNIMEDRFKEAELDFNPDFEVTHANGKELKLTSSEDLFALDNPVNNPITELKISAIAMKKVGDVDNYFKDEERRIMHCYIRFDSDRKRNIHLSVKAQKSPKLSNQIFAELEEQIERTFSRSWVYRYLKSDIGGLLLSAFVTLLGVAVWVGAVYLEAANNSEGSLKNRPAEIQKLMEQSGNARTLEEKMDFVFQLETKQLELLAPQQSDETRLPYLFTLPNLFIALPLFIIIGCVVYLVKYCYPRVVFLWGDYETYCNERMGRKKTIWTVVVASLLIGIVVNLFSYGLSDYLK